MLKTSIAWAAASTFAAGMMMASAAQAAPSYGDLASPGWYAGSGPLNGNFTIETSNGIELGLRAKNRVTVLPINGSGGVYAAQQGLCDSGVYCGGAPKARWNYEFSVNTSGTGLDLSNFIVQILVDIDPSAATNFVTLGLSNWGDNEYIDGAGPKRIGGPSQAGEDGVQQSVNPLFGNSGFQPGFDPFASGLYDIELNISDLAGRLLAETSIQVAVPEPESVALLGAGLLGLGFAIRRRKTA